LSPSRRTLTILAALVLAALCALPQASREHDFCRDIKRALTAPDGDEFFTKMKDALVPGVVPYWQGSYISGTFGEHSTVVLGMTDSETPEVTLVVRSKVKTPPKRGALIQFEGVACRYTREPFMLTIDATRVSGLDTEGAR
jgi:hypothetical protein